jgi:serine/threonine protein kinase
MTPAGPLRGQAWVGRPDLGWGQAWVAADRARASAPAEPADPGPDLGASVRAVPAAGLGRATAGAVRQVATGGTAALAWWPCRFTSRPAVGQTPGGERGVTGRTAMQAAMPAVAGVQRCPAGYLRPVSEPTTEPQRLGPYRLVERIGEGGMGVVHLAVGPTGTLVAVKALRPWLVGGHDSRTRFGREVAALRRVRGPRIAEVIDADVESDPPYVVTRYVRGPSLDRAVADHGPLRFPALGRLSAGLAEALVSVHEAGVVHRDVKPGNVVLAEGGPVLIDFGLARAVDETRLTATGLVIGTPGYLAPETIDGAPATPATDVHGWAATVAFAATGRPPFGAGPDAVVLDRIRRGDHDLAGVPPELAAILNRALAVEPERRPTVEELCARLATAGGDVTAVFLPATPTAAVSRSAPPTRVDLSPVAAVPAVPNPAIMAPVRRTEGASVATAKPSYTPPARAEEPIPPGRTRVVQTWPARVAVIVMGLAILMTIGLAPYLGAVVLFLVILVARATWRTKWRLYERRATRGLRRNDQWLNAIGTPWDLVVVALPAVAQCAWVCLVGYAAGAAVAAGDPGNVRWPYLVGGAVTLLFLWFGPGTARFRYGIHVLTAPIDRNPSWAWTVAGVFLVLTWALVLVWDSYGTSWAPGPGPPNLFGT